MLRRYPTGEERCIACKLCEAVCLLIRRLLRHAVQLKGNFDSKLCSAGGLLQVCVAVVWHVQPNVCTGKVYLALAAWRRVLCGVNAAGVTLLTGFCLFRGGHVCRGSQSAAMPDMWHDL